MPDNAEHPSSRAVHFLSILCEILQFLSATSAFTTIKAGIILTLGTDLPYDYNVVAPALEAAYERALLDYNVNIETKNYLYEGGCSVTKAVGMTMLAANESVDFIIGPACTEDMMMSLELQTFYLIPSVTGGGDLVDSTAKFPYVTRCSYNTYTQWTFVVRICAKYNWTNVAIINDVTDHAKTVNSESLLKNLRTNDFRAYPFGVNASSALSTQITYILNQAGSVVRIMVFLMNGRLLRAFLIAASQMGFGDGSFVFLALDPFMNDILASNGWKQNDKMDPIAFNAYKSLFVLTLRDTQHEPRYKEFVETVRAVGAAKFPGLKVTSNYYIASFYDSVLLYALTINETLELGHAINKSNTLELSQKFWNRTFPGASGLVYINPDGDRNDDHSIFDMQPNGEFIAAAEFFGYKDVILPGYVYDQLHPFNFNTPGNRAPPNEPPCGYIGDKCDATKATYGITFGVIATAAVVFAAVCVGGTRRIRRNQELQQLDLLTTWPEIRMTHLRTDNQKDDLKSINSNEVNDVLSILFSSRNIRYYNVTIEASFRGHPMIVRLCGVSSFVISRGALAEIKHARSLIHENVLNLQGLVSGPGRIAVLYSSCSKGSLWDLLDSSGILLDWIFRFSLISGIASGLDFIHRSHLARHGRLSSHCIFVDSRFIVKIADCGLPSFLNLPMPDYPDSEFCSLLLWTAPELLGDTFGEGTQEGDVYSFSIISSQIINREHPFSRFGLSSDGKKKEFIRPFRKKEFPEFRSFFELPITINRADSCLIIIVARIKQRRYKPFRPKLDGNLCPPEIAVLIQQCWAFNSLERPRIAQIKTALKHLEKGNSERGNVLDILVTRMETYALDLERMVEEKTIQCLEEKGKTDRLLYDILPRSVADRLKSGQRINPEIFNEVSIQYSDIVNFTTLSSYSTAQQVVDLLNGLYIMFDRLIGSSNTHKIETIGDCYVVASGVPVRNDQHAVEICRLSLSFLSEIKLFKIAHRPREQLRLRLGVHTGSCVAGVVGTIMPRYCLFGETVTIAEKMEATSEPMRIQLTESCVWILRNTGHFETEKRDMPVQISETLSLTTYWLLGERQQLQDSVLRS